MRLMGHKKSKTYLSYNQIRKFGSFRHMLREQLCSGNNRGLK